PVTARRAGDDVPPPGHRPQPHVHRHDGPADPDPRSWRAHSAAHLTRSHAEGVFMNRLARIINLCGTLVVVMLVNLGVSQAQPKPDTMAIKPFEINVDDAVLKDLKERLARTRFPDTIDDSSWDYGVDLGYMRELVGYWKDKYDWRAQEKKL